MKREPSIFPCLLAAVIGLAGLLRAADYDFSRWLIGNSAADVVNAAKIAYDNDRPLVVLYSNLGSCAHCEAVWNNSLCDGGVRHKSSCRISSSHPIREYARENKLVLLYLASDVDPEYRVEHSAILNAFKKHTGITDYSTIAIMKVTDQANLDNPGNTELFGKNGGTVVVGKFRFLGGFRVYAGSNSFSLPSADSDLRISHFKRAMEAYFPNDYWTTMEPPLVKLTGYDSAVELTPLAEEAVEGGVIDSANGAQQWYRFAAEASREYRFSATAPTASSARYGYAFYTRSGLGSAVSIGEKVGSAPSVLTGGFSVKPSSSGEIYLRIYQLDMSGGSSAFELTYSAGEKGAGGDTPGGGDEPATGDNDGEWEFDHWIEGNSAADVHRAVKAAKDNERPLLILYSNLGSCAHCVNVWNNSLCDGGVHHSVASCAAAKSHPIREYARRKKLVMLYLASDVDPEYRKEHNAILTAFKKHTGITDYSTIAIMKVTDQANLDNPSDTGLLGKAGGLSLIGRFRFLGSFTVYGKHGNLVLPSSDTQLRESHFERAVELFFPNDHWSTIDPPIVGATSWRTAVQIAPFEHRPGEISLVSKDVNGVALTCNLNGGLKTHWYRFDASAGRRYSFLTYAPPAVDDGITVSVDFFKPGADGTVDDNGASLKGKSASGGSVIANGFYLDATEDGVHYIRIRRDGGDDVTGFSFTLCHYDIPSPAVGEIANPMTSGAQPGKWTTDLAAAKSAADRDGKALLACFEGVRWCPYCIYSEYELFGKADFADWAKDNAYLVTIDNKLRSGTGPSLYNDDWAGGWMAINNISAEQAANALAANAALQTKYALPWRQQSQKPIGYPTLLAVDPLRDIVLGRISPSSATLDDVKALAALATAKPEANHEELDNYISGAVAVEGGDSIRAMIGGVNRVDWRGFAVAPGDAWSFTVKVDDAAAAGESRVELALFDVTGVGTLNYADDQGVDCENSGRLIGTATGSLADGVAISQVFNAAGEVRLRIKLADGSLPSPELAAYTLAAGKLSGINCEVSLPGAPLTASKYDRTVAIPVTLIDHNAGNDEAVSVTYAVVGGTAQAGRDFEFDASADHTLAWTAEERHANVARRIEIPLPDNEEIWDGHRSFTVRLEWKAGPGRAVPNAEVRVDLIAKPGFAETSDLEVKLVRGVHSRIEIPIHASDNPDNALSYIVTDGALPSGMAAAIVGSEALVISGVPAADAANGEMSLKLRQSVGTEMLESEEGRRIVFTVGQISDLNSYADAGNGDVPHRFSGELLRNPGGESHYIGGVFDFEVLPGRLAVTLDCREGRLCGTLDSWSACDSYGKFIANFKLKAEGVEDKEYPLTLELDGVGGVSGSFGGDGEASALAGMARTVWTAEEIKDFKPYYTVAFKAVPEESHPEDDDFDLEAMLPSLGGMAFSLGEDGSIAYTVLMRDAEARCTGTAHLQKSDDGTADFSFFCRYESANGKAAFVGGKLGIMNNGKSDGYTYTVSDCNSGRTACYDHSGGATPMNACGIDFDQGKPLYRHIGGAEGGQQSNRFFFGAQTPDGVGNGRITAVPRTIMVSEGDDGQLSVTDENPYRLSIIAETDAQGRLTGFFHGSFRAFVSGLDMDDHPDQVVFSGVYTPIEEACCSSEGAQPAGRGFYMMNDALGAAHYFNVRLYPESMMEDENGEPFKGNPALPESALSINKSDRIDDFVWTTEDALSASGQPMHVLAVDANGGWKLLEVGMEGEVMGRLYPGAWTLYFIGAKTGEGEGARFSDGYRIGNGIAITIVDVENVAFELSINSGWNLLSFPWATAKVSHGDYIELLNSYAVYVPGADGRSLVRLTAEHAPLRGGDAFWVRGTEDGIALSFHATLDETRKPAFGDSRWHLCAPHDNLEGGMLWDGMRYQPAGRGGDATRGGWFRMKAGQ